MGFNNKVNEDMITEFVNDTFYLENQSNRGIIRAIRSYSEIIVRKYLNLAEDEFVTLGNNRIKEKLKNKSNSCNYLISSIEKIQLLGNESTHTQRVSKFSDEELTDTLDYFFNLISHLDIDYFNKYKFGSNKEIACKFSTLPPNLRYKVLNYLYQNDRENIFLINKLVLSLTKTFGKYKVKEWVEENKEFLLNTSAVSENAKLQYIL